MSGQKFALISVSDKSGLEDFAKNLSSLGFKILASGGTAKFLREHAIPSVAVDEFTGSPEILGGRVKTLHPKIHGGILFDRENKDHLQTIKDQNIHAIDLVVVNLYPFVKQVKEKNLPVSEAIEFIDIGGPTLLRAAAKNFKNCLPVMDPADYSKVISYLKNKNDPTVPSELAVKVFTEISSYDHEISSYIGQNERSKPLRYGENPGQKASLQILKKGTLAAAPLIAGKALSYNNYLDLDAAIQIVRELNGKDSVSVIKHTNPCGCASRISESESYFDIFKRAHLGDPQSAFGGIVAMNFVLNKQNAEYIKENMFVECIAALGFEEEALEVLKSKKNMRLLKVPSVATPIKALMLTKPIDGGFLKQENNYHLVDHSQWELSTPKHKANLELLEEMSFSFKVCKNVRSNAIVLAKHGQVIGVGAGQMSRIDALEIAIKKAAQHGHDVKGSVMASDGFFPFKDCVELALSHGVSGIVQPGGSKRDSESVEVCDQQGIPMYFTGQRGFLH